MKKPEKVHSVFILPFVNPKEPKLLCEEEEFDMAYVKAKAFAKRRWDEGLVGLSSPEGEWRQVPVEIKLDDGIELPPVEVEIFPLTFWPANILGKKAEEVTEEHTSHEKFLDGVANLLLTMYEAKGIGIAAPQVGIPLQIIAVDTKWGMSGRINPCGS